MEIDPMEFGAMRANVETLMRNDGAKTAAMEKMATAVQAIELQLAQANGGWKMFIGIGTALATVSGSIGWLIHEFFRR